MRDVFGFGDVRQVGSRALDEDSTSPNWKHVAGTCQSSSSRHTTISMHRAGICWARIANTRPRPCRMDSTRATERSGDCTATASSSASCARPPAVPAGSRKLYAQRYPLGGLRDRAVRHGIGTTIIGRGC